VAELFTVDHADAITWLRGLLPSSVDLVVTDPAYESLEKHRAKGTTTRLAHSKSSSNDWFPIFRNERYDDLFRELFRVLREGRHMYVICDQETMFIVKPIAERHGFRFWKPLIWDKVTIGMGYHYRGRYEVVLFFEKPGRGGKGRKLNDLGIPDVLRFERVRGGYPTEKPVMLLMTLISQSSDPDDLVIDPFTGSGSTGVAALRAGRRFHGCDVVEAAAAAARERIAQSSPGVSDG
jgi:site-specific DNA-methyltransferase (adenine-specific)